MEQQTFFDEFYNQVGYEWKLLQEIQRDILDARGTSHVEKIIHELETGGDYIKHRWNMGLAGNSRLYFMAQVFSFHPQIAVRDVYLRKEDITDLMEAGNTHSQAIMEAPKTTVVPSEPFSYTKQLQFQRKRPEKPKKIVYGMLERLFIPNPHLAYFTSVKS